MGYRARPTVKPKSLEGSALPVGKPTATCKTACTMPGYPTAHGNRCDRLSKGYRCRASATRIWLDVWAIVIVPVCRKWKN